MNRVDDIGEKQEAATKEVLIKATRYNVELAHPGAKPGRTPSGATICRVTGVPADLPNTEMILSVRKTAIWLPDGPYIIPWALCGEGKKVTAEDLR